MANIKELEQYEVDIKVALSEKEEVMKALKNVRMKNSQTGNMIKWNTAYSYPKDSRVHKDAAKMLKKAIEEYKEGKDKPMKINIRAWLSKHHSRPKGYREYLFKLDGEPYSVKGTWKKVKSKVIDLARKRGVKSIRLTESAV